jgi:hypothetical protein
MKPQIRIRKHHAPSDQAALSGQIGPADFHSKSSPRVAIDLAAQIGLIVWCWNIFDTDVHSPVVPLTIDI